MLARLRHPRLILRPVHALAQFVNVGQHLPLFLPQTLEASADFLPLLLRLRLLQRGLQFFDARVEVLLALRQFLQTVQHLKLLALLGILLR